MCTAANCGVFRGVCLPLGLFVTASWQPLSAVPRDLLWKNTGRLRGFLLRSACWVDKSVNWSVMAGTPILAERDLYLPRV